MSESQIEGNLTPTKTCFELCDFDSQLAFSWTGTLECWFAYLGHEVEQVPVADSHPAATYDRFLELA